MSKGKRTKKDIIDKAFFLAGNYGLEALSIGALATETGLSKSGLFAHFKSKEALQIEVIEEVRDRFTDTVIRPALAAERGEPRARAFFEHYLNWIDNNRANGGCILMALCHEYDDRPGPVRDKLMTSQLDFQEILTRMARTAKEQGHFSPDLDPEQFAFEVTAIEMAYQHQSKFLKLANARQYAEAAFNALLDRSRAASKPKNLSKI